MWLFLWQWLLARDECYSVGKVFRQQLVASGSFLPLQLFMLLSWMAVFGCSWGNLLGAGCGRNSALLGTVSYDRNRSGCVGKGFSDKRCLAGILRLFFPTCSYHQRFYPTLCLLPPNYFEPSSEVGWHWLCVAGLGADMVVSVVAMLLCFLLNEEAIVLFWA